MKSMWKFTNQASDIKKTMSYWVFASLGSIQHLAAFMCSVKQLQAAETL